MKITRLFAIVVALLVSGTAAAHANGKSYLRIESGDDKDELAVAWDIPVADLQWPLDLDADGDGVVTRSETDERAPAVARFAIDRLAIHRGGADCRLSAAGLALAERESLPHARLRLNGACQGSGALAVSTGLFFGSLGYSALLDVETAQGRFASVLSFGKANWTEPAGASAWESLWRFLREGTWHVLIGYDHIVFLLLLLLPSVLRGSRSGWTAAGSVRDVIRDLVKIVTAFTIAHSVTLGLAATGIVRVPAQPVEVAISASIVVAGLLNLFPAAARWRLRLAFGFGFVHGFGFANALQEIGANGSRLAPMLAGFNLGVEVAQLLIVALVLPILWLASRAPRYAHSLMPALSLVAAATGAVWLAGRM